LVNSLQDITLDICSAAVRETVPVKQGDTGRCIRITLVQGDFPYPLPPDCYAVFTARKSDGTILFNHCEIQENALLLTLTQQTTAVAGRLKCEIKLYGADDSLITTAAFRIVVEGAVYEDGRVESTDEFSALTHLMAEATCLNYTARETAIAGAEAVWNAQNALTEADIAITGANTAAAAANEAASRANAASSVAYEADRKVEKLREVVSKLHSNITEEASGEVITLADASDLELAGLTIYGRTEQRTTTGKNLLPNTATTQTVNGVTFTKNNDGSVVANGTCGASQAEFPLSVTLPAGNYILSGCPQGGSAAATANHYCIYLMVDGNYVFDTGSGKEFTVSVEQNVTARITARANGTYSNLVFHPMIRPASITDDTYEPYTGGKPSPSPEYPQELESLGDSVNVTVAGKNLLKQTAITETINGVTFTVNEDGSITVNGTATNHVLYTVSAELNESLGGKSIILSGCPKGGSATTYNLQIRKIAENETSEMGDGVSVMLPDTIVQSEMSVRISVTNGTTVSNLVFRPMIRLASVADATYKPYEAQTLPISTPVDSSGNTMYLPGIPVESGGNYTDETGRQWLCDEVDFEKGVYVQRVGVVDYSDSNAPWATAGGTKDATKHRWVLAKDAKLVQYPNIICDAFCTVAAPGTAEQTYLCRDFISITGSIIVLYLEEVASMGETAVNAWLREKNVKVLYILAEEKYLPLTAEELAAFAALHTNYPNTTIFNDAGAYMKAKYVADTKLYVDKKFQELAAALVNNT